MIWVAIAGSALATYLVRALPVALQAVPGSLAVLLMLAKLVETTFRITP